MRMLYRMGGKWETLRKLVGMFRDRYSTSTVHSGSATAGGDEIYRIVFALTAGPNAGALNKAHGLTDIDDVVRIYGVLRSGTTEHPFGFYDGTNHLSVNRVGANLVMNSNLNLGAYAGDLVLEYTKT